MTFGKSKSHLLPPLSQLLGCYVVRSGCWVVTQRQKENERERKGGQGSFRNTNYCVCTDTMAAHDGPAKPGLQQLTSGVSRTRACSAPLWAPLWSDRSPSWNLEFGVRDWPHLQKQTEIETRETRQAKGEALKIKLKCGLNMKSTQEQKWARRFVATLPKHATQYNKSPFFSACWGELVRRKLAELKTFQRNYQSVTLL